MRFISTRVHGMMDYLVALLLIASPWLFGFHEGGAETWIPVVLGAGVVLYSLVTDYELGVASLLGMKTHLALDAAGGVLLVASPWIFGFAGQVWVPHVVIGAIEIGAALCTRTVRGGAERRERGRAPGR